MSRWSLYPLARGCRAPRRIMPELEATAPAIRATRSSRLDGAAAAGRTMVRSTSAAVAGFVSTIDIAGRTSRVLLLSLIPRGNPVRGRTLELGRSERTIMPAAAARAGRGSSTAAPIESALPGGPARPLSPTSRAKSAASRPTRTRRLAGAAAAGRCRDGLFIPWRVGAERRAGSCPSWRPRRPRSERPARADWTARRLWPNDGEVDVGGCRRFRFNH